MKLNEHERPRPNVAGLASLGQQAEIKLLLAGGWPPLKPLPVFKYETDAYRVSIDFDKLRGEWVCRKTSLPSNKAQELRGGLREIIRALPNGQSEVIAACSLAGRQEHELDKDVTRRLQAILEWKTNYENGALYSGLSDYLSESQRQEIEEILRLTLTARQLQFSAKNVSYVFDALSKAGGKLATLMEIAQRNKRGQQTDAPAKMETAAPVAEPDVPAESLIPATLESLPEEPVENVVPEQDQPASPEWIEVSASPAPEILTPRILDADPPSFVEDIQQEVQPEAPVAALEPQFRKRRVASPADRMQDSPSHPYALQISGFHLAAFAFVFLFAVISLPIALTVGRGPIGQWLRDTEKSISAVHPTSPPFPDQPVQTPSRSSAPPPAELEESRSDISSAESVADPNNSSAANIPDDDSRPTEKPAESSWDSKSLAKVPPIDSNSSSAIGSKPAVNPEAGPERNASAWPLPRNAVPPPNPKPGHSPQALSPMNGVPRNPAAHIVVPTTGVSPHRSSASAILVTAPVHGSKPFRVTFPEKPIAASSSIAMTSELSVLIPPQSPAAAPHRSARLQAGELAFFVWPRYQRPGDGYGSAETIKVRATVGQVGQVLDVKLLSGSASLLPATIRAIRQWRFKPTLLNRRPIQGQQDVTIEYRPSQYLSQVHTQHPSHN
ncbi:MAG TPA: energy transducer TonB [Candidatus Acidoferrum sp.]|nr:energy transducer TonB [Candidatus Acidoferrum sp.]